MITPLCELALKYGTDKCPEWRDGTGHEYTPFYHNYLFKDWAIFRMLEIGIDTGASLRMWADYWPKADIIGMDIVPFAGPSHPRIKTVRCNQGNLDELNDFMLECPSLDLIIDDGSHEEAHQILSANTLVPLIVSGGMYIIEDVQAGTQERIRKALLWPSDLYELQVHKRSDNRLIVMERP